jgi:hypothetical protein
MTAGFTSGEVLVPIFPALGCTPSKPAPPVDPATQAQLDTV